MANFYKKSHQSGRSMIEMLGVLAIIGVLSVAGIAGYSKAMQRHNLSETVQIFNSVIRACASLKDVPNTGLAGRSYDAMDLVNLGVLQDCKSIDSERKCRTPTGAIEVSGQMSNPNRGSYDKLDITIVLSKDMCADFLSYNWHNIIPEDWKKQILQVTVGRKMILAKNLGVDNYNMQGIADACGKCSDENCEITIYYTARPRREID